LDKAKQYIQPLDALHRVEFALADVDQLKTEQTYDAALSILVTHFVPYAQKLNFFKAINSHLKQHGVFIGFDLTAIKTDQERGMLQHICEANGLSTAQSTAMLSRLADDFYPLYPNFILSRFYGAEGLIACIKNGSYLNEPFVNLYFKFT